MKNTKPYFWYTKNQRNGILSLGFIIIVLQLIYWLVDFSPVKKTNLKTQNIVAFQAVIDSLKLIEIEQRKPKIYPFNPSFITDYKGYKLGMTTLEIDRLMAYRKKGKYINSASQFQEVTEISDSLLARLQPFFKFPDWVNKKKRIKDIKYKKSFTGDKKNLNSISVKDLLHIEGLNTKVAARIIKYRNSIGSFTDINQIKNVYGIDTKNITLITERFFVETLNQLSEKVVITNKDLNKATINELKSVNGIGDKLAARIIKFRKSIQGFHHEDQLKEVYGLDDEVVLRVLNKFKILSKPTIVKIDINEASFKEILHLPYIDYKLTKKIFEYKEEFAEIQDLEELKKIDGFPLDKYDRIVLYLKTE